MQTTRLAQVYDYEGDRPLLNRYLDAGFVTVPEPLSLFVDTLGWTRVLATGGHAVEFNRVPEGIVHVVCLVDYRANGVEQACLLVSGAHDVVHPMPMGRGETLLAQLRPGSAKAVLGVPASAVTNALLPAEMLWGTSAVEIAERIAARRTTAERLQAFAAALVDRVCAAPEADLFVMRAAAYLRSDPRAWTIHRFNSRTGYSERQTRRKFDEWLGLPPKTFAKTLRLMEVLREASPACDWSLVARRIGYHDHAHLIHDFKKMVGMTPRAIVEDDSLGPLRKFGVLMRR